MEAFRKQLKGNLNKSKKLSKKFISQSIINSFHKHQVDVISDGFHMRPGPNSNFLEKKLSLMYLCKAEQRTETLGRKRQRTYILIYGDAMTHNFLEVNLLTQSPLRTQKCGNSSFFIISFHEMK